MQNKRKSNPGGQATLLLLVLFYASLCLSGSSCRQKENLYRKTAILMDTAVTITVSLDSKEKAEEAIDEAFREIKEIEGLINFWSSESEISAINKKAGIEAVKVSPRTLDMVEKAVFVSEKTGGAFDGTVGPLIRLYDFKNKTMPDRGSITKMLSVIGYRNVIIDRDKSTVFLRKKGMSFDTGGIAKGYTADIAVSALKRKGIKAGMVAIAGDIKTFGRKSDDGQWLIGIRNPRAKGKDDDIMATIRLSDEAISTSGDYERYFIEDGKRYHHIINPKTGMPAQGCQSVSIIAKEGVFADGFSTGIFVMGEEEGMRLMRDIGLEGIIVDGKGEIHITDGIKNRVKLRGRHEG